MLEHRVPFSYVLSIFYASKHLSDKAIGIINCFYKQVKLNVELKTLLIGGLSELEIYGDLVNTFKNIIGQNYISDQFLKIANRHKRTGYRMKVIRQTTQLARLLTLSRLTVLLPSLSFTPMVRCVEFRRNEGSDIKLLYRVSQKNVDLF